ncbi:uncharacterized protein PV09_00004 [Verruconis gallopava]|uniref:Pre-mRNA-splicing factor CWC2 n=1 Tax=Verruconis gallopava TaxID=253628 RepID=A0A0D2ARE8_9PEZI|nr:uncharacterized protein PV09_00004 [Verruconis gallopava]KIW09055.1 hypothetical protein PV09_00004 [Verruconis gallopava]
MTDEEPSNDAAPSTDDAHEHTETSLVTTNPEKRVKKIKKIKKKRPARVQVDPATFKTEPPPQTGTVFNIWYNKWSGGDRDQNIQHAAPGRCNIARDSGYTRADSIPGSYFCLFFARGICPKGRDCQYLHRLPGLHDIFSPQVDCFGREKFADYRDDMGGVGSFMRMNRTLYVGRIHVTDDIEEVVSRHFQEWGQIDRIRVLTNRGVAFVTYSNMANSEFAKEAMAHQSLDHEEVLNVRWATVDPNPAAQKREARAIEEQAAAAIRAALPPDYVAQLEGRDPEATKRRKIEGSFGLEGYEAPDDVWQAREQANWIANKMGLDEGGQREVAESREERLIADGSPEAEETPASTTDNGIFSSSTLTALNGRKFTTAKSAPTPSGPLVAYGSDDDSD